MSMTWRRFSRSGSAMAGLAIILLVVAVALLSLIWTPHPPAQQDLSRGLLAPMERAGFVLGTDLNGRDLLSRIMVGARASLFVGIASVLIGGLIGITLGLLAGYFGGRLESAIMRLVDIQLSVPGVLIAIAILAAIGKGLLNVVLVLGIVSWVQYARYTRGGTLATRSLEFVSAARALGVGHGRILLRHILPNILPPMLTVLAANVSANILNEAALSYLGVGVSLSTVTWGGMLNEGRALFDLAWWNAAWPGLAILLIVFGINLFSDGLSDRGNKR